MSSKPLVRVTFHLTEALDPDKSKQIFTLDIPSAGEVEVTLDRDQMGVPFIAETAMTPTKDFSDSVSDTRSAILNLQDMMVRAEIAMRNVQSELHLLGKRVGDD